MTIETLIAVAAILYVISVAAERFIEFAKPWFNKITNLEWQASIKLLVAVIVGTACAALFKFDMLTMMGIVGVPYLVSYAGAGLMSSVGSTTISWFLKWLRTLQNDTTTTATKTISDDNQTPPETVIIVTTETSSTKVPVEDAVKKTINAIPPA